VLLEGGAGPLAGRRGHEWDNGEVVASADLDHETVGVVEEELVNVDAALLHPPMLVRDAHLLEPPLHHLQALALHITHDTSPYVLRSIYSHTRISIDETYPHWIDFLGNYHITGSIGY
jgi:hypothetical protein